MERSRPLSLAHTPRQAPAFDAAHSHHLDYLINELENEQRQPRRAWLSLQKRWAERRVPKAGAR